MAMLSVLEESLKLLYKKPKMFLPNMTVAVLYAILELILLKLSIELFGNMAPPTQEDLRRIAYSNLPVIITVLAAYPFLAALDLISYAMYPSLVSDHYNGKDISLGRALKAAIKAWRLWVSLGLVILLFILCVTPIFSLFIVINYLTQNPMFFAIGIILLLAAIMLLMLAIFFVMPIGIIEKEKTLDSFRKSYALGKKNKKGVIALVLFSSGVILAAFFIGSSPSVSSNAGLTYLAIAVFMLVKMMQSTIYTYISVVNPYFYLDIRKRSTTTP